MAANEALKKTEVAKVETKAVAKDSISALLTDGKDTAATKKGNNPLLDKIIGQGGGPVLGLFSPKDTATVGGYLRRPDIRILLGAEPNLCQICLGKTNYHQGRKRKKY